ncbi:transcription factor bHLH93-like isoform X2 [Hibiscus syriacus]|uniref:Transcription factor bHLH93-like isoform X2 n=1 Tax=Hibiscus syriacus TaxID=106335 RepID=A0A6A2Y3E7_HIBSY|nr:transcription factor bHLH93-like isoform X2 [Hibiscus syriacus]
MSLVVAGPERPPLQGIKIPLAVNKTSIIVDASRYIEELKEKVEMLNQEIGTSQMSTSQNPLPVQVTVETLEKGFLINVFLEKNCPGLLVSVLETFEELGLDVLDARVSCEDSFQLEAIGGESNAEGMDAQMVKQAMMQAISLVSILMHEY